MHSKDGYRWTEKEGLVQGVPTIGLILPPSNVKNDTVYDVIIIGAGYSALTAARDATISGRVVFGLTKPFTITYKSTRLECSSFRSSGSNRWTLMVL
jgi:hypothetical protein